MDTQQVKVVWCDISFEDTDSYRSMQDEFNETITAVEKKPIDPIDTQISDNGREEFELNEVPITTVRTIDDTLRVIKENLDKKVYVICSGTIGRCLVPRIAGECFHIHRVYIYTHNILLHTDWADKYIKMVRLFDIHTDLLVRLTRDISYDFIERGRMFLQLSVPHEALPYFVHARNLEISANRRDNAGSNSNQPDFRDRLDLLEGENGLIFRTKDAIQAQKNSIENS